MELSGYWQAMAEVKDKSTMNRPERGRGPAAGSRNGKSFEGRVMSIDMYLAVPTFIRRGIIIKA